MYCPNCGNLNPDNVAFCSYCGAALTSASAPVSAPSPAPAPAPVPAPAPTYASAQQAAPAPAPVLYSTDPRMIPSTAPAVMPVIEMPREKTNIMCRVGFFIALVSIVLAGLPAPVSLILSIIGIVSANKNKENGRGFGIAGMIISLVIMTIMITAVIFGVLYSDR